MDGFRDEGRDEHLLARDAETRSAFRSFGPPIYVPAGAFDGWTSSGWSTSRVRDEPARITGVRVGAHDPSGSTSIQVRTSLDGTSRRPSDADLAATLISRPAPPVTDVPRETTVTRRRAALRVDGAWIAVDVLACGNSWHAGVLIEDRWVDVEATGIELEDVGIVRVDRPSARPDVER